MLRILCGRVEVVFAALFRCGRLKRNCIETGNIAGAICVQIDKWRIATMVKCQMPVYTACSRFVCELKMEEPNEY